MDGWKTIRLPFWHWQFPGAFAVSFSEVYLINQPLDKYMGLQHPFNMVAVGVFGAADIGVRYVSFREL